MRRIFHILTLIPFLASSQFYVGRDALVHVSDGANLEVRGDLQNFGALQNLGIISLFNDWTANNNFNGIEGELRFLGSEDQMVRPNKLEISSLTVNTLGSINFLGEEYIVRDRIEFRFGTVEIGDETRFVLGENASVIGGSNDSYFDGSLISKGSGIKVFPIGSNGVYSPLTLLDVFGNNVEIEASYNRDNPVDPEPGDSLLGVSNRGYWELELIKGVSDESQIQLEFSDEDLTDFRIRNFIRHISNEPSIAFTENLTNRWQSLGTQEITNSDSLTFGTILAERPVKLDSGQKLYFAIGLAPKVPGRPFYFIPEVFSPNAQNPDNRTFKVFGERITNQDFSFKIFNRLGAEVYSTSSFIQANETGWDGRNAAGIEEPSGVYFYSVRIRFDNASIIEQSKSFYMIR